MMPTSRRRGCQVRGEGGGGRGGGGAPGEDVM